ncbi:hypothetical protein ACSBR1_039565 [Camellia fascicularis]
MASKSYNKIIDIYDDLILQELIVIDDLLSALVGIEGRYTSIKRVQGKDVNFAFQLDASMDLALQVRNILFVICDVYFELPCFISWTGMKILGFTVALLNFKV